MALPSAPVSLQVCSLRLDAASALTNIWNTFSWKFKFAMTVVERKVRTVLPSPHMQQTLLYVTAFGIWRETAEAVSVNKTSIYLPLTQNTLKWHIPTGISNIEQLKSVFTNPTITILSQSTYRKISERNFKYPFLPAIWSLLPQNYPLWCVTKPTALSHFKYISGTGKRHT